MHSKNWPVLKPDDSVEIIVPAGRIKQERLSILTELLSSWQLKVNIAEDIQGDDLLCANSDAARLYHLQKALLNSTSKAIICARGGYGAMRLLPALMKLAVPAQAKLFIGMSDITALHLFLQQQWGWATLHGSIAPWHIDQASIQQVKQIFFGEVKQVICNEIEPLNAAALCEQTINSPITGGNLCLVQSSLATPWQISTNNKIILLEEVNERSYKVDRMLEQLYQAGIFTRAKAVIFGDFIGGEEPNGSSLIKPVLKRFAERLTIPVVQIKGIGHGNVNWPVPLNVVVNLHLGSQRVLECLF